MQATDADILHYRLCPVATEDNTMAEYTLTYDILDGTGDVPTGGEFEEGTTVTLDDGEGLTKGGFTFGGWSETEGGDAVDTPYVMPAGDTTLYAVWVAEEAPEPEAPEPMEMEDFIAECDRLIGVCRDLIDGADYEKGFPAKVVLRETAQDKIMGIRGGAPVKIRNVGFDY